MGAMRSYTAVVVAAVLAGMLVPWPAQATDLILRQKVTNGGPHPDSREEMQYWTADRMVTDSPDSRVIIDLNARTMTVANKREHTYFTQTAAEMRQNADAMQAEMKKHMENLPPQAREMMEKMHGGMGPQGFTHTTEVVEVMQQSPPADVMKVPDGYKQVEAPSRERGKRPMGMAPQ